MSQPVILKIYGNLSPCAAGLAARLAELASAAIPPVASIELSGALLTIAFEGIYYPVEETLAAIAAAIGPEQRGRLDVFDLEAWQLGRHHIEAGQIRATSAPLNTLLANSVRPEAGA